MTSVDSDKKLAAHIEIITLQYSGLKDEVNKLNKKVDDLDHSVDDINLGLAKKETSALRSIITVGISIIAALIGTVGGLVWYVIMNH